jgi:hypothetical protein
MLYRVAALCLRAYTHQSLISPFVLVHFDHVALFIVNANDDIM